MRRRLRGPGKCYICNAVEVSRYSLSFGKAYHTCDKCAAQQEQQEQQEQATAEHEEKKRLARPMSNGPSYHHPHVYPMCDEP